jgi:hypothetical protein
MQCGPDGNCCRSLSASLKQRRKPEKVTKESGLLSWAFLMHWRLLDRNGKRQLGKKFIPE